MSELATARGLHRIVMSLPDDAYTATIKRFKDSLLYEESVNLEKLDTEKYLLEFVDKSSGDGLIFIQVINSVGDIVAFEAIGVSEVKTDVLWLVGYADTYGVRYPLAKDAFVILNHSDLHYLIRKKLKGNRFGRS